jgi:hypothetical protein
MNWFKLIDLIYRGSHINQLIWNLSLFLLIDFIDTKSIISVAVRKPKIRLTNIYKIFLCFRILQIFLQDIYFSFSFDNLINDMLLSLIKFPSNSRKSRTSRVFFDIFTSSQVISGHTDTVTICLFLHF